jgi:hypothetical protein
MKTVVILATVLLSFLSGYQCKAVQDQAAIAEVLYYVTKLRASTDALLEAKTTCTNEAALRWWLSTDDLNNVRLQLCSKNGQSVKLKP